ncbi:hypothetical protein [Actinomadura sp. NPDC000929]|uniref:hypothetical protein n=1 Tax=Actinomadura sp. NPDC000929 TaxID=3154517 RepID=UPI003396DF43
MEDAKDLNPRNVKVFRYTRQEPPSYDTHTPNIRSTILVFWLLSPPSGLAALHRRKKRGDRWHRSGSPGGSLRDQVLASLEPAFGRDRNH